MANLVKDTEEQGYRARMDKRHAAGVVVARDDTTGIATIDVGATDANGTPIYKQLPYQPQNPPRIQDVVTINYTNVSPHSGYIAGSQVAASQTAQQVISGFSKQAANTFFAAPDGTAGVPNFRSIVLADLPPIVTTPPRKLVVCLCEAFTPSATGADAAEFIVPGVGLTFTVLSLTLRVSTAGGAPSVRWEKSSGTGVFSPTTIGTVTLASGAYEGSVTVSLGTVASGDKIRFYVLTLGTATGWTVQMEATT